MINGKSNLLYQGYTYYRHYQNKHQTRWSCTNYPKCQSFVFVKDDLVIGSMPKEHNHTARKLHMTSDGVYIRV